MKRSKVKKIILANRVKCSKSSQICYLCDAIKQTQKNYNLSSLLMTVRQWDTKGSSKIRRSIKNLKCFVCNYNSNCFNKWKAHIMSNGHMSMCHTLNNVCSYFCEACKTLFYGSEMCISQHKKDVHGGQSNLSGVSILMSELMNCLDIHSKHIYFCNLCNIVSETPIHTSGKHFNNQKLYDCKYCNTTFLCKAEELDFHEASVEHLTFKCIYSIKEAIEVNRLKIQKQDQVTKNTHDLQTKAKQLELPLIILDRFQKTSESMAKYHTDIKKRKLPMNSTISENNKLLINCSNGKSHSAISSTNTDHNTQQNVHFSDDNVDDGVEIAYLKSTAGIIFAQHTPKALHHTDVSTSFDDLRQTNITKEQKTIQSGTQSNITTPYKQIHPSDTDQLYGQYVIERLKNIHNTSLKSNIKIEIDALFCIYT